MFDTLGYPYRVGLNTAKHYNAEYRFYFSPKEYIFNHIYGINWMCIVSNPQLYVITIPLDADFEMSNEEEGESDKIIVEKIIPLWDIRSIQYIVSFCRIYEYFPDHYIERARHIALNAGHHDIVDYFDFLR